MARQHHIDIFCDICLDQEVETEGEELPPVQIGNQKARVLALCKQHRVDLYEPLATALAESGIFADKLIATTVPVQRVNALPRPGGGGIEPPPGYSYPARSRKVDRPFYKVVCPIPECRMLYKDAAGVSSHLREDHKTTLFDAIGPDGRLYDYEGNPVPTPKPRAYSPQAKANAATASKAAKAKKKAS